jgi:bifunctional ADP-heptose synthase (sugar kinase/adenylyltransferase)
MLSRLLEANSINLSGTLVSPEFHTLLYAKVVLTANGLAQEDSRLDFVQQTGFSDAQSQEIIQQMESALPTLDALLIADYQREGVVTGAVRDWLNTAVEKNKNILFCVDSRKRIGAYHQMILKPNLLEARSAVEKLGIVGDGEPDVEEVGKILQGHAGQPVYITLGQRGCYLAEEVGGSWIAPLPVEPPIDPVGAGDTFLSALAASLSAGATPMEAGQIASLAAAVILKKIHTTGTATLDEMIAVYQTHMTAA